jgi:hypothetical protein
MLTWGSSMRWVLRLIETGMPSGVSGVDVMEISRPDGASNIADLGLTLSEAKQLLARVQQAIVAAQAGDLAARRPECPTCRALVHFHCPKDNDRLPPRFPWAPDAAQTQRRPPSPHPQDGVQG